jgi:hypothetical protein
MVGDDFEKSAFALGPLWLRIEIELLWEIDGREEEST